MRGRTYNPRVTLDMLLSAPPEVLAKYRCGSWLIQERAATKAAAKQAARATAAEREGAQA